MQFVVTTLCCRDCSRTFTAKLEYQAASAAAQTCNWSVVKGYGDVWRCPACTAKRAS